MSDAPVDFVEWLAREGYTQTSFAAVLGVPKQTVNNWCTGRWAPTQKTLQRLLAEHPELGLRSFSKLRR